MSAMDEETEPMPLTGDRRQHRKLVRFDPTLSMGSIAQIVTVLVALVGTLFALLSAYGKYESDRTKMTGDIEALQKAAVAEKAEMREVIRDLRADMRNVQQTVSSVDKTVTGIKAEIDAKKGKP